MSSGNFTLNLEVDPSPEAAYAAINNVRGWWSEDILGVTDRQGATFDYRYRDIHRCTMKVEELVPGKRVAWFVVSNHFNFTKDETEWTGTRVVFDISRHGDKTVIRFTHVGLTAADECYDACSQGWGMYIGQSLRGLISHGKGSPNVGEPLTQKERALSD